MQLRDLSDAFFWIRKLAYKVDRLYNGTQLENSSITNGRMRFIGGLLLIDTGGTLQVIGHFNGQGDFVWSGPWKFNSGDGEIAGNVKLTGDFDLTGELKAGPVTIRDGKVFVGEGSNQIVIDGATGKIIAGDVEIELNKITVGGGDSPATLEDGALGFETGGKVQADSTNNGISMSVGPNKVYVGTGAVAMQLGSVSISLTPNGITFGGLPTTPKSLTPEKSPIGSLYLEPSGQAFRVIPG